MKILVGDQRIADYHARVRVTAGTSGASGGRARLSDGPPDFPVCGTTHLSLDPEARLAPISGSTEKSGVAP